MASQPQTTSPGSNRKDQVPIGDFEETASFHRRCCCVWAFPCYGSRKTKDWERISMSENEQNDGGSYRSWWGDGLKALRKVREWSELVAGPKWKTFIRRFNRSPARLKSGKFQYDPYSYSLNFDQGPGQNGQFEEDGVFGDFPSRYAAIPAAKSGDVAPLT